MDLSGFYLFRSCMIIEWDHLYIQMLQLTPDTNEFNLPHDKKKLDGPSLKYSSSMKHRAAPIFFGCFIGPGLVFPRFSPRRSRLLPAAKGWGACRLASGSPASLRARWGWELGQNPKKVQGLNDLLEAEERTSSRCFDNCGFESFLATINMGF